MQHLSSPEAEESPCLTLLLPPIFAATYDLTYPDHHNNVLVKIPQALNCEYPPCRGTQKEWRWDSLWYFLLLIWQTAWQLYLDSLVLTFFFLEIDVNLEMEIFLWILKQSGVIDILRQRTSLKPIFIFPFCQNQASANFWKSRYSYYLKYQYNTLLKIKIFIFHET